MPSVSVKCANSLSSNPCRLRLLRTSCSTSFAKASSESIYSSKAAVIGASGIFFISILCEPIDQVFKKDKRAFRLQPISVRKEVFNISARLDSGQAAISYGSQQMTLNRRFHFCVDLIQTC